MGGFASQSSLAGAVALVLVAGLAASADATLRGRNGLLTWQQDRAGGPPVVYVANPDGTGLREVFSAPNRAALEATFSPTDPDVMFFSRGSRTPYSEDLFTGSLATGTVKKLSGPGFADIAAAVSPDGKRIAYFAAPRPRHLDPDRPGPPEQIHVMNVDGSADERLTPVAQRSIDPDWSPDGTRIVYAEARIRGNRGRQRLRIMSADGTVDRALTPFGGRDELNPKWMPDGRTIVYESASPRGTLSDILAIDASGGSPRPILATSAWETNPIPSPDGTRIAFTSDRDRRGRERLGRGFELYTMAVDGTGIVRLTTNARRDSFPDWQRLP